MLGGLAEAASLVFQWPHPLLIVAGTLFGMLIGIMPGLAGAIALILLIPISYGMPAETAVIFLIAAYSPAGFGGMLTSILVNTPGAPENAATTFDGYAMARQGQAPTAIGAATVSSFLGGLFGTVILLLLIPLAQKVILAFSYPEFFMMAIFGLTVIAVVTEGRTHKGLVAAGIGFLLATIGLDPVTGDPRFTFGQVYLWDGIELAPALIGLFAGSEVLALYTRGTQILQENAMGVQAGSTFVAGAREALRKWALLVRSSVIGVVIGIIPGVGGSVSGFLAYGQAVQSSKTPERFGKGAVEGVIAAESANDAKEGGSLLPTVAFGIPGSAGMAVLLGALLLHGVPAGPTLLTENPNIIYALIMGMVVAKVVASLVVWAIGRHALRFTRIRAELITPLIVVAALVGVYAVRLQFLDVLLAVLFGYVGYLMRAHGFSRIPLIIALLLGELVESSYHQTVAAFGGISGFVTRPISAVLLVLSIFAVVAPIVLARRRRAASRVG